MSTDPKAHDTRTIRERCRELIDYCNGAELTDLARDCIDVAIRHGLWNDPAQRPIDFDPRLSPQPVYEAEQFPVCRYLELHCRIIQAELVARESGSEAAFLPVEEPLVSAGGWDEVVFYEGGIRYETAARAFPATAAVVDELPQDVRQCGVIMLSRLRPGTHIMPHCGLTNRRLRVHLGLRIPQDAVLRIADRFLQWEEGKCLIFDDSFEHEIWQFGQFSRVVLLVDTPHPAAAGTMVHPGCTELEQRIATLLKQRGLRRMAREAETGRLTLEPDDSNARLIRRIMAELNAASVGLDEHGELVCDRAPLALGPQGSGSP